MNNAQLRQEPGPDLLIEMDRRSEPRISAGQTVTITGLPEMEVLMPATLTDISSFGLGLNLEWPIKPGASFAVEWEDTIILAEATYCVQQEDRYHAGVRTNYIILDRTVCKTDRKHSFVPTV